MPERTVIQWEKDDLEALGLLKVDVLALGMLSAIRRALDLINTFHGVDRAEPDSARQAQPALQGGVGIPASATASRDVGRAMPDSGAAGSGRALSLAAIPAEDPAVYAMIQQADTIGVFQIESRAQMSMLPRLKPNCFYDLVIEVAIVRPGPIQGDMVHPYLRRRQGREKIEYPSDTVRGVLERTLGVPIFQEQVIKLAMVAAGFTPGEADHLRRAMAAWKRRGGLEPYERKLKAGMRARGYRPEFAERLYRQILGFGNYGFPESHAASFALLVYVSAWLKHYHPAAFCAALIDSQPMGFYAPAQLVRDAREHGVEVRPADVNHSDWDCSLEPVEAQNRQVQPALQGGVGISGSANASRHVGRAVPDSRRSGCARQNVALDAARQAQPALQVQRPTAGGDPALRLGLCMVRGLSEAGARRIASARGQGAFADVQDLARRARLNRADLKALAAADTLQGLAGHRHLAAWAVAGVEETPPLYGLDRFSEQLPLLDPPSAGQAVLADYVQTGLTLREHPLALIREQLRERGFLRADEIGDRAAGQVVRAAGLVLIRQRPGNGRAIFVTLEDESGGLNLLIWADLAERQRRVLLGSQLLGVVAEIQRAEGVQHLMCRRLEDHSDLLNGLRVVSRDFQ
jgi:error-prone DNA polymerase